MKLASAWLAWLAAGSARADTLQMRDYQIRRFALDHADRAPLSLTTDDLASWIAWHGWSREASRSYRAALRSFYGWAHATGRASKNPAALLRPIKPMQPQPRPASDRDIDAALTAADDRQRLGIELGARYGLRRAEMARVHSRDLQSEDDGCSLLVHGKGGKTRVVPISAAHALQIRAAQGYAFPSTHGGHLTPAHLGKVIQSALPPGVTTHMLRHRFATTIYRGGVDIRTVQLLLGHASVATTQVYTKPRSSAARRAIEMAA